VTLLANFLSFTINGSHFLYGDFINVLITFISIAAAVFLFVVTPVKQVDGTTGPGRP
jgi:large conductance mechanosensitive channel